MSDHACPFCTAALNLADVPAGAGFRCGGCGQALEAGESRLSSQEVRAYRGRQKVRRLMLCMVAADLAAVVTYFLPVWSGGTDAWMRWLATALAAMVVGPVLFMATSARRAPVPVAPPLDKVQT
ncbi:MAG: hypothetical protein IPP14_11350 [Planctomycetes bacterium]|nr:hypothetical protein [Planctomycetota bacterium]